MRWIVILAAAATVVRSVIRLQKDEFRVIVPRREAWRLVREGHGHFKSGNYDQAAETYARAEPHAVNAQDAETLGYVRLHLAHALFAASRFREASEALTGCLAVMPELPYLEYRRQQLYADPREYEREYTVLLAEAAVSADAERLFLAGYESYFNGRRGEAAAYLQAALEAEPGHEGATAFKLALSA